MEPYGLDLEFFELLFQGIVAFLVILFLIVLVYVIYRHFSKKGKVQEERQLPEVGIEEKEDEETEEVE